MKVKQVLVTRFWVVAALLLVTPWLAACGTSLARTDGAGADLSDRTVAVVATTGQVGDLVKNVGGDRVRVTTLMGPGVDPHLYKASARDVITIEEADAIFYNGLHLEGRMLEIIERLESLKPVYAVTDAIPRDRLRQTTEFAGNYDPHVWFDPTLWMIAAEGVAEQLATLDPEHADVYRDNAERESAELAELDTYAEEQVNTIPPQSRVLITAHDAFGYFGDRYDIEVRGLQGISTASEAGAADIQQLAAFITEREIPAIFVETSVSPATINAVRAAVQARGYDVQVGGELYGDALGEPGTPEGTYIGMFRYNVDTITKALTPEE